MTSPVMSSALVNGLAVQPVKRQRPVGYHERRGR